MHDIRPKRSKSYKIPFAHNLYVKSFWNFAQSTAVDFVKFELNGGHSILQFMLTSIFSIRSFYFSDHGDANKLTTKAFHIFTILHIVMGF